MIHEGSLALNVQTLINEQLLHYSMFFPIYYVQLGADNMLLGYALFLASICEIPFLLFADKILDRIGTTNALTGAAVITAVRWFSFYFVNDLYINLALQILHGAIFIVFSYSLTKYLEQESPQELKSVGQSMITLSVTGIAPVFSGIVGGYLSDLLGIRLVFLILSIITIAATLVFVLLIHSNFMAKFMSKRIN
ncbi:MFS transporter [Gorillibacterium sp. sgz5001074]|uniref:MFS transporter n=1 Tax=Gorillibacterium sp. sgz5001074 TaxID=3446695 RepID=UPI003F670DF9